jgi:hypothetical protein
MDDKDAEIKLLRDKLLAAVADDTPSAKDAEIKRLREALLLAASHIGWCWDVIEHNTRFKRAGSRDVHKLIVDALAGQDIDVEAARSNFGHPPETK